MTLGVLAAVFTLPSAVSGSAVERAGARPDDPPAVKCRVVHLRIVGEIDNARLGRDFAAAAAEIGADDADLVVLEIGANRWRADVLRAMVEAVRAAGLGAGPDQNAAPPRPDPARPRWIVWLNDPEDRRVGGGAMALGVLADRCYAGPKVEVVHEPGDDQRELAPVEPAVDWSAVEQELRAAVWRRQSQRKGDLLLAAAVPVPGQLLWVTPRSDGEPGEGRTLRIVERDPGRSDGERESSAGATAMVFRSAGADAAQAGLTLRMSPAVLAGLGVVSGQAKDLGQILAAERLVARSTVRKTVASGLIDARRRLTMLVEGVDAAREKLDHTLDVAERERGHDAVRRRQRAGSDSREMAEEAIRRLMEAEALTADYPELLREVPPGQTRVGINEVRLSAAWVNAFQSRRQALAELKNRAARLASEAPR